MSLRAKAERGKSEVEQNRKNEEEQLQEHVAKIEEVRAQRAKAFESLVIDVQEDQELAKKVSSNFPTLRVTLVVERGATKLSCTPMWSIKNTHPTYALKEAEAAVLKIDEYWPTPAEVHAFIKGLRYEASEIRRLKQELEAARQRSSMHMMYPPPFYRGGFPFGP